MWIPFSSHSTVYAIGGVNHILYLPSYVLCVFFSCMSYPSAPAHGSKESRREREKNVKILVMYL